jgi:DNA repair exonuclease SbcCD ATPase subunit
MRLASMEIVGFRGFTAAVHLDLDADAVLILGNNGQGKTSLFDAILWCLTGSVGRVGEDTSLISLYSQTGEMRVALAIKDDSSGSIHTITRSSDGVRQLLSLESDGQDPIRGDAARLRLLQLLWAEGLSATDGLAALSNAMTRSVYLQQDLIRQFVDADDDQERFTIVSELVGSGRVTELQGSLERGRNSWSRAITESRRQLEVLQARQSSLQGRVNDLRQLDSGAVPGLGDEWALWWESVRQLGINPGNEAPPFGSVEALQIADRTLRTLESIRQSLSRRIESLQQLNSALTDQDALTPADVSGIQATINERTAELDQLQSDLTQLQAAAAAQRAEQLRASTEREELRVLATLALRHLEDKCPVCAQSYDHDETVLRLSELAESPTGIPVDLLATQLASLSALIDNRRVELSSAQQALRTIQRTNVAVEARLTDIRQRLQLLEIEGSIEDASRLLNQNLQSSTNQLERVSAALADGERLSLNVSAARERSRESELTDELESVSSEIQRAQADIEARERTGRLASLILDALREASIEIVENQVIKLVPLFQRIYGRIDPHPAFRSVNLLTSISRGRGRLSPALRDLIADVASNAPSTVLSSSQSNALAVSLFLALNLAVKTLPLQAIILDDPLQSLDDVNLLGMVDLLRRTTGLRQLIVSTHDARFAGLLEKKLRPVTATGRTTTIRLEGWARDGPQIHQTDVAEDSKPLKLVG